MTSSTSFLSSASLHTWCVNEDTGLFVITRGKAVASGVSPNTADVNGIPAILWAVTGAGGETIKALLAAGTDLRSKDKPGRRALLYFPRSSMEYYVQSTIYEATYLELVQSLLKAGADVNAADNSGTTALMLAKQTGNARLIKLLESAAAQHN